MGSTHSLDNLAKNSGAELGVGKMVFKHGDAQCVISFREDLLPKSKRSRVEHYFTFLMCKIAREAVVNGELKKDSITFNISELVELGMFSDYSNAKRAVDELGDFISKLHVDVISKEHSIYSAPIYHIERHKSEVTVHVDRNADWARLTAKYLPVSDRVFALSPAAFRLMAIINEWIRINAKNNGYKSYIIPLEGVVSRIGADFSGGHSKRALASFIKDAVDEINRDDRLGVAIQLFVDTNWDTKQWLEEGYLKVCPDDPKSRCGYVYKLLDENDDILYIGKTNNISRRMDQHKTTGHLPKECYDSVKTVEW